MLPVNQWNQGSPVQQPQAPIVPGYYPQGQPQQFAQQPNAQQMFGGGGGGGGGGGYVNPGARNGVMNGNPTAWDFQNSSGQNMNRNMPGVGQFGGGGQPQGQGNAYSMDKIIQAQMDEWNRSDQANNQRYNDASGYLKGLPAQYANNPLTKQTQGLVGQFLSNPEALNDHTVQAMRNQMMNQIMAQKDSAFRQGSGILAAGGNDDASTLSALAERLNLGGMSAGANANTQLGIQRANQRNQDWMNAANLGRGQSLQDSSVPMQVGQSIMSNLPQQRPNDYAGLGMLGLQAQIQQMLGQHSPGSTATHKVGGGGPQQMGGLIQQNPVSQESQALQDFKAQYPGANPADWGF